MRAKRLRSPVLFRKQRRAQCPACLDRDAVNLIGRPRFLSGMKLTGGCEVCGGSGEVTEAELVGDFYKDKWVLR